MASCKHEQAIKARQIAIEKMSKKDYPGAKKSAMRAQKLQPDLHDIDQIILVCDVHCSDHDSTSACGGGDERDWYRILDVDPAADEASVRRQYTRMALNLHPDKNRLPGANDAFQLVCRARAVLTDEEKRRSFDSVRSARALERSRGCSGGFSGFGSVGELGFARFRAGPGLGPTTGPFGRAVKERGGFGCEVNGNGKRVRGQNGEKKVGKESEKSGVEVGKSGSCGGKLQFPCNFASGMDVELKNKNGVQVEKGESSGGKLQFPSVFAGGTTEDSRKQNGAQVGNNGNYGEKLQFPSNLSSGMTLNSKNQNGAQVEKSGNYGEKLQFPSNLSSGMTLDSENQNGAQVEKSGNFGEKLQFPSNLSSGMTLDFKIQNGAQVEKSGNFGEKLQFPSNISSGRTLDLKIQNGTQVEKSVNCGAKLQFPSNLSSGVTQDLKNQNGAQVEKSGTIGAKLQFPNKFVSVTALDLKNLEYSDSELNDFEKGRAKKCFNPGQIWAVYDTLDAMPRFYAWIDNVISDHDFKLQITWLEPLPDDEGELKWLLQGLPASCGKFKRGESEIIEDHAIFSHLVNWETVARFKNMYQIYPRKGETWAIFNNWKMDWCLERRNKEYEFEFVEILSDYDCGVGVNVAFLGKIKGFSTLFSRMSGENVIPVKDRFRFSHRVASFQVTSNEGQNGNSRFFELDPASLPGNFSSCGFSEISKISEIFN